MLQGMVRIEVVIFIGTVVSRDAFLVVAGIPE
jgi:hypothetical protein